MTYSDFVNSFSNAFNLFLNGLITISNSLFNNYIFITLLGLSLFIFLFNLLIDIVLSLKKNKDVDSSNKYN